MLLSALSLLTARVELLELSLIIVLSFLGVVDTWVAVASVNSVDLEAGIEIFFFDVMIFQFLKIWEMYQYRDCTVQLIRE